MSSEHVTTKVVPGEDSQSTSKLRKSDAIWLRRGQRLGELLLVSREPTYGWAAVLALMGASLVVLALIGPPEPGMTHRIGAETDRPP